MMKKTPPEFEHQALERDIAKLAGELKEHQPEETKINRAAVKQVLHGHFHAPDPNSAPAPASEPPQKTSPVLPNYLGNAPADIRFQIEKLIDFAWHKGIFAAIKAARKSNPLVIDAFHDALIDKVYDELKKQGHLK